MGQARDGAERLRALGRADGALWGNAVGAKEALHHLYGFPIFSTILHQTHISRYLQQAGREYDIGAKEP